MQRGQATIEYVLLATALIVAMCLLVRFETPVQWLARAVVHTIVPARAGRPHHGGGVHHRHRPPHPCLCRDSLGSAHGSGYQVAARAAEAAAYPSAGVSRLDALPAAVRNRYLGGSR